MGINIPDSASTVDSRMKADVQGTISSKGGNAFLRNSFLGDLITSTANRVFDFYFAAAQALKENFPDQATTELDRWLSIFGITKTAGAKTTGIVVATGNVGAVVPAAAILTAGDGSQYEVTANATVTAFSGVSISSITRSGSTATATTAASHDLASNVLVTITGANEAEYNVVSSAITVTGVDTFEYEVSGTPASPATGTIVGAWSKAAASVESVDFGDELDQVADEVLQFESPANGIDDLAGVDQSGLVGGIDQETSSQARSRMLDRIRNPVAHFNVADIVAKAKTVSGVTRVFVQENTPALGQVTIYFVRDNDAGSIIPDSGELTQVKNALLEIKPANTADADVIVSAPSAVTVNFTFTSLTPDTAELRTAISASLAQFFSEIPEVGVNLDEDAYRSAIFSSVGLSSGAGLTSFVISSPSGDISISSGEIAVLGTVTYP